MRKLFGIKNNGIAAMGIGAMIVLIAMILVAGVAASVLISTSNTLQSQSLKTGSQTTREVSSGLSVFNVLGMVTDGDGIEYLAITVTPRAGSGKIDLNNTYILMSDGDEKALLTYGGYNNDSYWDDDVQGDIFTAMTWNGTNDTVEGEMNPGNSSNWTWGNDVFGIGVLQDYDDSMTQTNPVLTRGDKAILYIACNNGSNNSIYHDGSWTGNGYYNVTGVFGKKIETRADIFGRVIPEVGSPGVISFSSPKAYVDTIYTLQ